jgi:hypothetical protein
MGHTSTVWFVVINRYQPLSTVINHYQPTVINSMVRDCYLVNKGVKRRCVLKMATPHCSDRPTVATVRHPRWTKWGKIVGKLKGTDINI